MHSMSLHPSLLVLLSLGISAVPENPPATKPPARVRLALVELENRTGDPGADHWGVTLDRLLRNELRQVAAVRLRSDAEIYWARRQLSIEDSSPLEEKIARRLGQMIEAQGVVWGFYGRQGKQWTAVVRILHVPSGATSKEIRSTSTDWYTVRDGLVVGILEDLQVVPTKKELEKLGRRETSSPEAFEAFSQGFADFRKGKYDIAESSLRRSLSMDPNMNPARVGLAAVNLGQGKIEEAEKEARGALKWDPEDPDAHIVVGGCLVLRGNFAEAANSLIEANRLDPENSRILVRLGEIHFHERRFGEAFQCLQDAKRLNPRDPRIPAKMALFHAAKGNHEEALKEAEEAENLTVDGLDIDIHKMLSDAFEKLGPEGRTVNHCQRYLALARGTGADSEDVRSIQERLRRLKKSVNVVLEGPLPPVASKDQLREDLERRLSPGELRLAQNPLESTPDMDAWARQLVGDPDGDEAKAHALFHRLMGRKNGGGESGTRTAREVFASWTDPKAAFNCEELAKLYVALARGVGLQAFLVHVEENHQGKEAGYACAAVIVQGKVFLVDPTHDWFGIPHHKFLILDDVQTIAHQLYQSKSGDRVALCRIAMKLHPGFAWGHLNLARMLIDDARDWEEAGREIYAAYKLEPEHWNVYYARGLLAFGEGEKEMARLLFERALDLNPRAPMARYHLAVLLYDEGKLSEAREHYRRFVRPFTPGKFWDWALERIAEINEKIGFDD